MSVKHSLRAELSHAPGSLVQQAIHQIDSLSNIQRDSTAIKAAKQKQVIAPMPGTTNKKELFCRNCPVHRRHEEQQREIALAHLIEFSDCYTRLEKAKRETPAGMK